MKKAKKKANQLNERAENVKKNNPPFSNGIFVEYLLILEM